MHLVKSIRTPLLGTGVIVLAFALTSCTQSSTEPSQNRESTTVPSAGESGLEPKRSCPLVRAVYSNDEDEVRRLWDECSLTPDSSTAINAFLIAARLPRPEVVLTFIELGMPADATDKRGITACMAAATSREDHSRDNQRTRVRVVDILLEEGADPNLVNNEGSSCLAAAAYSDYGRMTERLVGGGAQIDSKDTRGVTPLMVAAESGSPRAARALVESGADPTGIENSDGESACDIASVNSREWPSRIKASLLAAMNCP